MYLSNVITGQIFYEIAYGNAARFLALEDPRLETDEVGNKIWKLRAMNMITWSELEFAASPDAQHYLRLEPELAYGIRPGFALEWADSNVVD